MTETSNGATVVDEPAAGPLIERADVGDQAAEKRV